MRNEYISRKKKNNRRKKKKEKSTYTKKGTTAERSEQFYLSPPAALAVLPYFCLFYAFHPLGSKSSASILRKR